MKMRTSSFALLTALGALFLAACMPPSGGRSSRCDEGEERSCSCPGDQQGVQYCDDDGRFGTCRCPNDGIDGATPGDASRSSDGFIVRDRGQPPSGDAQRPGPRDSGGEPPLPADVGPSDFGRPDPDRGVRPRDMFVQRDASFVPPEDAGVDLSPPEPARDAGQARDVGVRPGDPRDGPDCRDEGDCERACEYLEACFGDERVCAEPHADFAAELRRRCDELCGQFDLAASVCGLRDCAEIGRVDPALGEEWENRCAEGNEPGPERDAAPPEDDPEDWGGPVPPPRDFGVPEPEDGGGMQPDPGHPGNHGPNCGGCEGLCEWAAGCFSFHPELCPEGNPALAREIAANCPAICRNPGLQLIACEFQRCGELSQVAGIIGIDIADACFEDEPVNPDPDCNDGSFIAGLCWTNLSDACHAGSATQYCADVMARLPTRAELERRFDRGWEPGPDYHTIAMQPGPGSECGDDVENVVMPSWQPADAYDVWRCGDNPGYCNRAVVCVR